MDYLSGLSPSQKKAVTFPLSPLLVIAGAGSGKTRVLTRRIVHLIDSENLKAEEILSVTFTRKAAGEMRERLSELLGDKSKGLAVGTFHSICARWLRSECRHLGREPNFVIYDSQDSERLITRLCKEKQLNKDLIKPSDIARRISIWKNKLYDPESEELNLVSDDEDSNLNDAVVDIYGKYTKCLQELNAFDFDDLICGLTSLLMKEEKILEKYRKRYRAFLIDEYQDTNHAQSRLMHLLATPAGNIFAVGDDDQSIYRFRGADVGNILRFAKEYEDASTIVLEENYRSTGMILNAALGLIQHNNRRHEKVLKTPNPNGDKIEFIETGSERDEALEIVKRIHRLVEKEGYSRSDIVILFRTNMQTRPLEDAFSRMALPYAVVGTVHFYERREVKDIISYLRLVVNPVDMESFFRVINVPRRGIGSTTIERVKKYAERWNITPFESLSRVEEMTELSKNSRTKLQKFYSVITALMELASTANAQEVMERLIEWTSYKDSLSGGESRDQAEKRKENVNSLVRGAAEFVESNPADPSIGTYLEDISLISDVDRFEKSDGVLTLMTMHSAKGLEFPIVFIAGAEDGIVPHHTSLDDDDTLEDERRLFYVGMTRAEKRLFITYATQRYRFDGRIGGKRSRFLVEIPEKYRSVTRSKREERKSLDSLITSQLKPTRKKTKSDIKSRASADISAGDKVRHKEWGVGLVVKKDGLGQDAKLTILFENDNLKKVLMRFASLEKI